jgi:hypothetical protein
VSFSERIFRARSQDDKEEKASIQNDELQAIFKRISNSPRYVSFISGSGTTLTPAASSPSRTAFATA